MDYRKDFEQSMLFRADLVKPGSISKRIDGTYVAPATERLYQGYEAAMRDCAGQLRRYSPDRYLSVGLMNHIMSEMKREGLVAGSVEEEMEVVRIVLRIVGGTPV